MHIVLLCLSETITESRWAVAYCHSPGSIQLGRRGAQEEMVRSTFANKAKHVKIKNITVMGSKEKVKWKRTEEGLKLTSPKNKSAAALVYKIELK